MKTSLILKMVVSIIAVVAIFCTIAIFWFSYSPEVAIDLSLKQASGGDQDMQKVRAWHWIYSSVPAILFILQILAILAIINYYCSKIMQNKVQGTTENRRPANYAPESRIL